MTAVLMFGVGSVGSGLGATLGSFNFNDLQFGNTLSESDSGAFRSGNWLNAVVRANPGNPGALTGPNVDTGISNIGPGFLPVYTIGYNTPIANGPGPDLGIISVRFSRNDTFRLALSADGITFTPALDFGPQLAVNTGVTRSYFYAGNGIANTGTLFVTPVDLSEFGITPGATISAARITASPEGDLIRVAGFASVPEPTGIIMIPSAILALGVFRRIRRS